MSSWHFMQWADMIYAEKTFENAWCGFEYSHAVLLNMIRLLGICFDVR